ncbi:hypothetical protein OG735_17850 [Streptomyces sp. NBC_01210]|uniref:hypothetical protein n=1 Tax=Streptomyces sp. NBC_01210 TaxID=2903774 RepID=UPI002E0EF2A8|nr:hypothetical protein OG735_17850 [Streptomyces sp. NBC_01210]
MMKSTMPRNMFTRTSAMIVAAVTAGAMFATATGAHAAEPTPANAVAPVAVSAGEDPSGLTPAEREQASGIAKGIAELGLTEDQFAAAFEIALTRDTPDVEGLHGRLSALPDKPTAQQTVQAAYPGDAAAQAALLPVVERESGRASALALMAEKTGESNPAAAFGWWDETKFIVKCGAAIAAVLISFAPAGSSIKVVRAVALFKRYGAKKTASIIWRFVNGKRVGSAEREAVKAFIGISAISSACSN